jgi:hypothetical protein
METYDVTTDATFDAMLVLVADQRPVLDSELSPEGQRAARRLTTREARLTRYVNSWRGESAFVTPRLYSELLDQWGADLPA